MQCTKAEFYYNIRPQSLQFQFNKILSQGHIFINTIVRIYQAGQEVLKIKTVKKVIY